MKEIPATRRLAKFLSRYSPEVRTVARAALAKMRARLPGSIELVYDNYNAKRPDARTPGRIVIQSVSARQRPRRPPDRPARRRG